MSITYQIQIDILSDRIKIYNNILNKWYSKYIYDIGDINLKIHDILVNIAQLYYINNNNNKAIEFYNKAIEFAKSNNINDNVIINDYIILCNLNKDIYTLMSYYQYLKKNNNNNNKILKIIITIADFYKEQKEYSNAILFYNMYVHKTEVLNINVYLKLIETLIIEYYSNGNLEDLVLSYTYINYLLSNINIYDDKFDNIMIYKFLIYYILNKDYKLLNNLMDNLNRIYDITHINKLINNIIGNINDINVYINNYNNIYKINEYIIYILYKIINK